MKELEGKVQDENFTFKDIENEVTHLINYSKMLYSLEEKVPGWHYVSGFTGCDGRVLLEREECGHTKEVSLITIRHMKDGKNLECDECTRLRLQRIKEERANRVRLKKIKKEMFHSVKNEQMTMKKCSYCGAFFYGFSKDVFCSDECKVHNRKKNTNRYKETKKRRCRTEESKYINLVSLYHRDNGICWLCGKRCDIALDKNNNYYPSIDHVVPISKGGKDSWDNVKLAHRICNTIKSNKTDIKSVREAIMGIAERTV